MQMTRTIPPYRCGPALEACAGGLKCECGVRQVRRALRALQAAYSGQYLRQSWCNYHNGQVVESYKPQIDVRPEWPMVELGEVCDVKSGGTPSRNNRPLA